MSSLSNTTTAEHLTGPWTPLPIPSTPFIFTPTTDTLSQTFSIDMSLAHNVMIRSLNSLYHASSLLTPLSPDVPSFAGYGLMLMAFVHMHHEGEEKVTFPMLQAQGKVDMGKNVQEHEEFQGAMKELEEYFVGVQKGEVAYDAERMRKLIKEFGDPLVEHLIEEIRTISPEKLSVFTNEELAAVNAAFDNHLKAQGGLLTIFPFGLTAHNRNDSPNWPVVPAPIKWFALNVGYWANRSYWKFSPYTRTGEPQTYTPPAPKLVMGN